MMRLASCHSDPAVAGEESLIMWQAQRIKDQPEMFESLASCFAFRCSASLNITNRAGDAREPNR